MAGFALNACGDARETAGGPRETVGELGAALEQPVINSPHALEQKFLPGMGYFDGTTCGVWPRDVSFASGTNATGKLSSILARHKTPSSVSTLKELVSRFGAHGIDKATVLGSKRELHLTYGTLEGAGEKIAVAVDESSGQGFAVDNAWLCTEEDLSDSPLNCQEHSVVISDPAKPFHVLARSTRAPGRSLETVLLVAPHVRISAPDSPAIVTVNVNLLIAAQRVFGGPALPGTGTVYMRDSDLVSLRVVPPVPLLSRRPNTAEWRAGLMLPRQPGLVAVFADEVGGLLEVTAESPASVETLRVGAYFAEPTRYNTTSRTLTRTWPPLLS